MSQRPIHQCQCEICQSPQPHADKEDHHRMNVLLAAQRTASTWYVALEAERSGMAAANGLPDYRYERQHDSALRRELNDDLAGRPTDRVRKPGGGRPCAGKKSPAIKTVKGQRRHRLITQKWVKLAHDCLLGSHRHTGSVAPQSCWQAGLWLVSLTGAVHPDRPV